MADPSASANHRLIARNSENTPPSDKQDLDTPFILFPSTLETSTDCVALVARLRENAGLSVLVDLSAAATVNGHCLESLCQDVALEAKRPKRLGILLSFEHWAQLHESTSPFLYLLRDKGVDVELIYVQQSYVLWFEEGQLTHDAARVIHHLSSGSHSDRHRRQLLEAASFIVDREDPACTRQLVDLACLALEWNELSMGRTLAQEVLPRTRGADTFLACRALRTLGEVMIRLRDEQSGIRHLEEALVMAKNIRLHEEAAETLVSLGARALLRGQFARAEAFYRDGCDGVWHEPSTVQVRLQSGLANALEAQGKADEAHMHRRISRTLEQQLLARAKTHAEGSTICQQAEPRVQVAS